METKYDVVIIGAGIGGLISGCYLAKAGLKVLIVEQHYKPGGYCTSFDRQGYRFDVGVHYLGGLKGVFGKILEELDLKDQIKFHRFDPTDKIIMPDNVTYIRANPYETIEEFKKSFPKEKTNIDKFFSFIMQNDFLPVYKKIKKLTFKDVLDEFFNDYKIKATFEALLFNFGISAKESSALLATFMYRDYILDGGYYPANGGMQGFSDNLADKFKENSGELLLRKKVTRILSKNKKVLGVVLDDMKTVKAEFVISNADASETFKELLENETCKEQVLAEKLQVSRSLFALYVGTDTNLDTFIKETCNMWNFNTYNLDDYFYDLKNSMLLPEPLFIMASFPSAHAIDLKNTNKNTIQFLIIVPFETKDFWDGYKEEFSKKIIKRSQQILPNLENHIKVKVVATPHTFYRYTLNKDGAAFGWLSTVEQTIPTLLPQKTSIKNLFLVGHWCTIGSGQGGVPKVMVAGRKVAELVLKN